LTSKAIIEKDFCGFIKTTSHLTDFSSIKATNFFKKKSIRRFRTDAFLLCFTLFI